MEPGPLGPKDSQRLDRLSVSLSVLASRPAARSAFAFLQLLVGPTDATNTGRLLLRVLHPTDELVACKRRDVDPRKQRDVVVDQGPTQVDRKLVDHSPGHLDVAHRATIVNITEAVGAD